MYSGSVHKVTVGDNGMPFDYFSLALNSGLKGFEVWKAFKEATLQQEGEDSFSKGHASGYTKIEIKTTAGKSRVVYKPSESLSKVQRDLSGIVKSIPVKKETSIAYEGQTIHTVLEQHAGADCYLLMDIKRFFDNIHRDMVTQLFLSQGYNKEVSELLSGIYCILWGGRRFLPQGAPVSPILSNRIAELYVDPIIKGCMPDGWKYLRYCDNIILISKDAPKVNPWVIMSACASQVKSGGHFRLHKMQVLRPWHRQKCLGLVLNVEANVPRRYYDTVRAILHSIEIDGWEDALEKYNKANNTNLSSIRFEHTINGMVNYIAHSTSSTSRVEKIKKMKERVFAR